MAKKKKHVDVIAPKGEDENVEMLKGIIDDLYGKIRLLAGAYRDVAEVVEKAYEETPKPKANKMDKILYFFGLVRRKVYNQAAEASSEVLCILASALADQIVENDGLKTRLVRCKDVGTARPANETGEPRLKKAGK